MNISGYSDWKDTATGIHMVTQMMGKTKLARLDPQPEWNHIVLELTAQGFSTGLIPYGDKSFSVDLHIREGRVMATGMDGRSSSFVFESGLSVSEYYGQFNRMLADVMCETEMYAVPQEVAFTTPFDKHSDKLGYDGRKALDFYRMCVFARNAILRFLSPFRNKKMLPAFFWGTFDTTGILFSGKSKPFAETAGGGGVIERVAFDEEMIEFGFWPGDDKFNDPAFFILPYPFLQKDLSGAPIQPEKAWYSPEKAEFFLKMSDLVSTDHPEEKLHDFFSSGYKIVSRTQNWENLGWFELPLLTEKGSEALRRAG